MIDELYQLFNKHPRVTTDSRNIEPGSIFFALRGDNFNGNNFALQALKNGCVAAVVDDKNIGEEDNCFLVEDTLEALQQLAALHRRTLGTEIIGITGSNGKTTTKELITAVMKKKFNFLSTIGNLNNHIGVPLTLLRLTEEHDLALVEMGANQPDDIKELCDIADPDHGIITNIGKAHLQGFGGYDGVLRTKKQLFDHVVKKDGRIFYNDDDPLLSSILDGHENKFSYGTERTADVKGRLTKAQPQVELEWEHGDYQSEKIQTKMVGAYNFVNMLAAISIGVDYSVPRAKINMAIAEYSPKNNRSQIIKESNTIILDAYNANPSSMEAAIRNLASMDAPRKFVILGDMFELGPTSHDDHQDVVYLAKQLGIEEGLLVGENFSRVDSPFDNVPSTEKAKEYFEEHKMRGYLVLIKGSRKMKLESLVDLVK